MRTATMTLALALTAAAMAQGPSVSARSALVMDADTGKVLFAKNPDLKSFPASTTKIMTALLLVERVSPVEQIEAPSDVANVTGSSLHLKPGEQVSAEDMLYALMLRSANDGSYAVAMHIAGSVREFSKLMNERAWEIGCKNTHFNNPNGLNDPLHTTTARDLALIAREAMRYPEFQAAARAKKRVIRRSLNQKDTVLVNRNKWLRKDATCDGIKTGYTVPAGHCFVGSATRNGYRVITVVLKSQNWQEDTKNLLNWTFKAHDRTLVRAAGEVVAEAAVDEGAQPSVQVAPERDVYVVLRKGRPQEVSVTTELRPLQAPIHPGQRVGDIVVTDATGYQHRVPAVALQAVPRQGLLQSAATGKPWTLVGGLLLGGVWYARRRARRRRLDYYARTRRSRAY